MARTTLTRADIQRLNLLATHASVNASHRARFHNFAADFEDMFPTPPGQAGQLDDSRSALGPSAYLVDLARLVTEHITQPDDQRALTSRRPDISELALSQTNDDQAVPYLQIANGVMRAYLEQTLQITPSALEALAQNHFPFSLPFHQPLTAIRSYLGHFKIGLADIDAAFGSGTSDPAWAAEMLNLAPGELNYLATPKTDAADLNDAYGLETIVSDTALGGLDKVAVFLDQTELTQAQLETLLNVGMPHPGLTVDPLIEMVEGKQGQPGGDLQTLTLSDAPASADYNGAQITITSGVASGQARTIIAYEPDARSATIDTALTLPPDPGSSFAYSLTWQSITGLNLANLDYLNRFIRLANRLGWSFDDLNWALTSLGATLVKSAADNQADIQTLAKMQYLHETYKLPIDEICGFCANLRTTAPLDQPKALPLFDRIFNQTPFYLIGTAQLGTPNTITLAGNDAAANSAYVGMQITITAGTGAGQRRMVTAYDSTTNTATVYPDWSTNVDTSWQYVITRPYIVGSVEAAADSASQIALAAATATNVVFPGMQITITAGTGLGQTRSITDCDAATNIATIDPAWTTPPDETSEYTITNPADALVKTRTALFAALHVDNADGNAMVDHLLPLAGYSFALALPTLTRLYRLSKLPRVLGMAVTDLLVLLRLITRADLSQNPLLEPSLDQAEVTSIDDLITLSHWVDWMTATGLNALQLQYLNGTARENPPGQRIFVLSTQGLSYSDDDGASWLAVEALAAATVTSIRASEDCLIATTASDFYISKDGGETWTGISGTIAGRPIAQVYTGRRSPIFYAITNDQLTHVSYDDGASWTLFQPADLGPQAVFQDICFLDEGLVFLFNSGGSKTLSVSNVENYSVGGEAGGHYPFEFGQLAASDHRLIVSTNGQGFLWMKKIELLSTGGGAIALLAGEIAQQPIGQIVASGSRLVAATADGVYYGDDIPLSRGDQWWQSDPRSWILASSTIAQKQIKQLVASDNTIVAATSAGLYLSVDRGSHWRQISGDPVTQVAVVGQRGLHTFQPDYLSNLANAAAQVVGQALTPAAEVTAVGNYRQQIQSWAVKPVALTNSGVDASLAAMIVERLMSRRLLDSNYLVVTSTLTKPAVSAAIANRCFALIKQGPFFSDDYGASWLPLKGVPARVTGLVASGDTIVASSSRGFYVSADLGGSWAGIGQKLNKQPIAQVVPLSTGLVAATSGGLYTSTDGGAHWLQATDGSGQPITTTISSLASSGDYMVAAVANGFYVGIGAGANWAWVSNTLAPPTSADAAPAISEIVASDAYLIANTAKGFYVSARAELTWAPVNPITMPTGAGATPTITDIAASGGRLVAATSGGLYESANNGQTWTQATDGIGQPIKQAISSIAASNGHLIAATNAGFYLAVTSDGLPLNANAGIPWIPVANTITARSTAAQLVIGGQLETALQQLFLQADNSVGAQYPVYRQSILKVLQDALGLQTSGTVAFWTNVFGADSASVTAVLSHIAGPTPIASALAQRFAAAKDQASSTTAMALPLYLAKALALPAPVFQAILAHADIFGLDLSGTTSSIPLSIVRQIADFRQLVQLFARQGDVSQIATLMQAPTSDAQANIANELLRFLQPANPGDTDRLVMLSGWDKDQIAALAGFLGKQSPYTLRELMRMRGCFALAARLGVHIQVLIDLYTLHAASGQTDNDWQEYTNTAQAFLRVLSARYSADVWAKPFSSIRDQLNELERDALAAFLLYKLQKQFVDIKTLQDLYEFLLVDIQMAGCAQTSYVREAIDCLQIYIQRCRMNLEAGVTLSEAIPDQMWDWMGAYRMWQANREIFFYPENYLDPTLRSDNVSPEFALLQNALLQGDISQDTVEQAYIGYFDRLDLLANLQIVNGCYATVPNSNSDDPQDALFLLGKTATDPPVYYQRQARLDSETVAGTAVGPAHDTSKIILAPTTKMANNGFAGWQISITQGTGAGQTRIITTYGDTTYIATVDTPWQTAPDGTSQYTISELRITGWSPWQKISVNIPAAQALPLYAANRLYIFWVEQKSITDQDNINVPKTTQNLATIKFSYQQVSGNWIQAQTLVQDVDITTLPQSYWFASGGPAAQGQGTNLWLLPSAGTNNFPPTAVLSLIASDWTSTLQPLVKSLFAAPGSVVGGIAILVNSGGLFRITNPGNGATGSLVGGVTGVVSQIVANPAGIYVGTSQGLFSSTDGSTWSQIPAVTGSVTQIVPVANSSDIYVGTDQGLFYSTDGNSWSQELSVTGAVTLIDPLTILVGTSHGLFSGPPWSQQPGVTGAVSQIAIVDVLVAYVGTNQGLFVNANSPTWTSGPGVIGAVSRIVPGALGIYVGTNQGLFYNPNSPSWSPIPAVTGSVTQIVPLPNSSDIYVGTSQGLFSSTNGSAWSQELSVIGAVRQIVPGASGTYIGTNQGLFYNPSSPTWSQIRSVTGGVSQIALIDAATYVGTDQGLFYSTDGNTWSQIRSITGGVSQIADASNIYVGIDTNLPQQAGVSIPLIAAGGDTWLALPQSLSGGGSTYVVERLTTSCVDQLRKILVQGGIDALLTLQSQQLAETPAFASLQPTTQVVPPYPLDALDFDLGSAYGLYFREIYLHIPYLVGTALQARQQFEAAKHWYEYIFDPLAPVDPKAKHPADRFWGYQPFRKQTLHDLVASIEQQQQYQAYQDDPFDPFAIAELRPYAYQKALAMQYLDNLIAWGDSLYALDGWENLNAATTLYVLAAELLGPRPQASKTYTQVDGRIAPKVLEAGNDLHQPQPTLAAILKSIDSNGNTPANPFFDVPAFFVIPENDAFAGYWNTVEQRLYQIRNCMNLQGVVRQLPIYEPALDPRQLLLAMAAGRSVGATTNRTAVAVPYYRFAYLLERTRQVVSELKQLGGDLLSALEKQDGEQLARLRNTYEGAILALTTLIKQKQQEENQHSLDGLQQNLAAAQARYSRYQGWATQYLSPGEQSGLSLTQDASALKEATSIIKTLSAIGYAIPNIYGLADGGMDFGKVIEIGADILSVEASIMEWAGQMAMTKAQYDRRQADWQLQADMANYEVQQISAQIDALTVHQAIFDQELAIHQLSITQNQGIDQFYRQKFSSQELYQWMVSQLGVLYSQTYQLALDLARMTERAFQYERDSNATYVNVNSWNSLKQGLLAGEGLALNLNQLEKAYIEQDLRRLEIAKTIALGQLDPQALLDLKRTGRCAFVLSEALFDLDFPGHYLRKIKTIALSIPAVVGPYQNIHATLIQQSNHVVLKPDLATVKLLLSEPQVQQLDSSTLRSNWQVNQQIALSRGMNDAGLFELNFNDERYLPFEGTGAVSSWELRMPMAGNRFSFDSISDVIITLRYTALDGGDAFRRQLFDQNSGAKALQTLSGYRLFTVRQLNPAGWQAMKANKQPSPDLTIDKTFFPLNLGSIAPDTTRPIAVYFWPAKAVGALTCPLSLPPTGSTPPTWTTTKDGMGWECTPASSDTLIGTWKLQAVPGSIDDLLVIVPFQGTLNWGN